MVSGRRLFVVTRIQKPILRPFLGLIYVVAMFLCAPAFAGDHGSGHGDSHGNSHGGGHGDVEFNAQGVGTPKFVVVRLRQYHTNLPSVFRAFEMIEALKSKDAIVSLLLEDEAVFLLEGGTPQNFKFQGSSSISRGISKLKKIGVEFLVDATSLKVRGLKTSDMKDTAEILKARDIAKKILGADIVLEY